MQLLNINQVSELLNIKVSTIYSWVHQRKIPFIKLYGKLCFEHEDITSFINSNRVAI